LRKGSTPGCRCERARVARRLISVYEVRRVGRLLPLAPLVRERPSGEDRRCPTGIRAWLRDAGMGRTDQILVMICVSLVCVGNIYGLG
jgi:hypothetical protein